jgi:hypothetical protein
LKQKKRENKAKAPEQTEQEIPAPGLNKLHKEKTRTGFVTAATRTRVTTGEN